MEYTQPTSQTHTNTENDGAKIIDSRDGQDKFKVNWSGSYIPKTLTPSLVCIEEGLNKDLQRDVRQPGLDVIQAGLG